MSFGECNGVSLTRTKFLPQTCMKSFNNVSVFSAFCRDDKCSELRSSESVCFRPEEFLVCEEPQDLKGNVTAGAELGYGCSKVRGVHPRYCEDSDNRRLNSTLSPQ